MVLLQLLLLVFCGWILSLSAMLILRSVTLLSHRFRIKSYILAFFLLGLATSTPEFFVALQSMADGVPQLAVGTLIGGSILLLSFVMGLSAVILGRIRLDHSMNFDELVLGCFVFASPIVVLWDGVLTRSDGLFLVGIYALHILVINRREHVIGTIENQINHSGHWILELGKVIGGLCMLALSSKAIIELAEIIVTTLGIPVFVFGLFVLSVGVNLPELALAWHSIREKRQSIAFGDFLGSGAANALILGMICLLSPTTLGSREQLTFALVLLGTLVAFFIWAVHSKREISRREGMGLLLFYILFLMFELMR